MNGALAGIAAAAALALALGFLARRGRRMGLSQWTVAGRGFGTPLVFLLMAGEIYTTFTFLGGSGFAYGRGGPAYYILCYGTLAYVLSYFLLPPIWRYARDNDLYSQSDFSSANTTAPRSAFSSRWSGSWRSSRIWCCSSKASASSSRRPATARFAAAPAIWIGAAVATAYVMVSGVRGSAWTAVAKDIMIMLVVVFLGIYFPLHEYGGIEPMLAAIEKAKPGFRRCRPRGESVWWFSSTVLLTTLDSMMWPHSFGSIYTARNASRFQAQRGRAAALPIGPAVRRSSSASRPSSKVPGLTGANVDLPCSSSRS